MPLCSSAIGPHVHTRSNHPWSPSEDEWLRKMARGGAKVKRISQSLRRTTRSIRRRAEVLQISWKTAKSPWPRSIRQNSSVSSNWHTTEEKLLLNYEAEWNKAFGLI